MLTSRMILIKTRNIHTYVYIIYSVTRLSQNSLKEFSIFRLLCILKLKWDKQTDYNENISIKAYIVTIVTN